MSKVVAKVMPGAGLGNQMFINAFAFILAKKTGRELVTHPIEYFSETKKNTECGELKDVLNTRSFGDQYVDFDKLYKHKGDIVVDSFLQKYYYYIYNLEDLQQFYHEAVQEQTNDIFTLYIRNGDYKALKNVYLGFDFYRRALRCTMNIMNYTKLNIVVEHIDNDVTAILNDMLEVNTYSVVIRGNIWDDFSYLCKSSRILMSQSTFAWWPVFLNNKKDVWVPVTKTKNDIGWWYGIPEKDDVDLVIPSKMKIIYT